MQWLRMCCLVLMLLPLCACSNSRSNHAVVLTFSEQEPGVEPYRTRMIVTSRYLRIDDGGDASDFVLFDRKQQNIFSTNSSDKRVLLIARRDIAIKPPAMQHRKLQDSADYPPVAGRTVRHNQYFTNGQLCVDVFNAEGLLPRVTQALREYYSLLAGEQASVLTAATLSRRSVCDLANNVFLPTRHLQEGFPVRYQDMRGVVRELADYREAVAVDPTWFVLPQNVEVFTTEQLRGP